MLMKSVSTLQSFLSLSLHPLILNGSKQLPNGPAPSQLMETFSSKNSAELCLWAGALTLLRLWLSHFYHRGGRGCQLLCAQERVGSRAEGMVINGGSCLRGIKLSSEWRQTMTCSARSPPLTRSNKALRRLLFLRVLLLAGASGDTGGKIQR